VDNVKIKMENSIESMTKSRVTEKNKKKEEIPLSARCSSAAQRPTCRSRCKQSSKGDGVKNEITMKECCALILVVKLKRTDTTLDLSQKARVVRISKSWISPFYTVSQVATQALIVLIELVVGAYAA
jgi:hypothetical protein